MSVEFSKSNEFDTKSIVFYWKDIIKVLVLVFTLGITYGSLKMDIEGLKRDTVDNKFNIQRMDNKVDAIKDALINLLEAIQHR